MSRVLLTGASGFVGRQVIAPLIQLGFDVHATARRPLRVPAICEHNVDLFDHGAVSKLLGDIRPTHLVHLAWYTKPPEYWHSPINAEWETHSVHLFESFVHNGGERLVGAGTCAEYEWGSSLLAENLTPTNPATSYGQAKLSLSRRGETIARLAGISFVWARFFFLFGPHERKERFVPSIIDSLLRGEIAHCRNGDLERDYLYVEDAGAAMAALARSEIAGTVNVASGLASQLGAIAKGIGAALRSEELVHVEVGKDATTQPASIVANVDRMAREVGWRPRYEMCHAIERTIAWRSVNRSTNAV